MHTRRQVLALGTAAGLSATLPLRAFAATPQLLVAREAEAQLAPEGYAPTSVWGFDGTVPGPVIRVPQGGRVTRRLRNDLPQETSVHWHGVRIDNAMDGVSGLTQDPIAPGAEFDIDFVAPDAGTYWYHAHNRSFEQVARGLYGVLIVEEPTPLDLDHDEALVFDDWRLNPETVQIDTAFEAPHDRSHSGRMGNLVTTNGQFDHQLDVRPNDRLRLRLVNAANARIFQLGLQGLEGWIVALDGMPLDAPMPATEAILLAPGQRADLIVDVTAAAGETAHVFQIDNGDGFAMTTLNVAGTGPAARRAAPGALPANPNTDLPDLASARSLNLQMTGGAMGGLQSAIYEGSRRTARELAQANQFWAFNDVVGMPDAPLAELSRGEPAKVSIRNDTAFPHAMHLHGTHFREVLADGSFGPLRDTLLVFSGETRDIAFVADNPGDWLFHCHMLGHAASGMMTWMRVA